MSYLVDTNVISEMRKRGGNPGVREWAASVQGIDLFLSVLVVGEIRRGIALLGRRDAPQAQVFEEWLRRLHREFHDRILPITPPVAEEWGRMNAPDPLPIIDSMMAATAKVHGLTLVTRNVADLQRTGVKLLNPFRPVTPAAGGPPTP